MNATAPKCACSCNAESGPTALIYSCSGAADVGEIADRAARLLDAEDKAWMSCLAGIGGRVSGPHGQRGRGAGPARHRWLSP